MSRNESTPDLGGYFETPMQPDAIDFAEMEHAKNASWHPEVFDGGIESSESTLALGGLRGKIELHYRSPDWIARATEMRASVEHIDDMAA